MGAASAIPRAPNPSASRASSQTQRETLATRATSTSEATIAAGTRTTPTSTSATTTTTKAASSQTSQASRGATSTPTIAQFTWRRRNVVNLSSLQNASAS
ncbi:unnamed protein product [Camellia sinensis]